MPKVLINVLSLLYRDDHFRVVISTISFRFYPSYHPPSLKRIYHVNHPHPYYKAALPITMSFNRFPTAPALGEEEGESSGSGLYPSLHEQATMPRSTIIMNKMVKTVMIAIQTLLLARHQMTILACV